LESFSGKAALRLSLFPAFIIGKIWRNKSSSLFEQGTRCKTRDNLEGAKQKCAGATGLATWPHDQDVLECAGRQEKSRYKSQNDTHNDFSWKIWGMTQFYPKLRIDRD
jgi:hypothetical protein